MQTQKRFNSLWLAGAFTAWCLAGILPALADTTVTIEQPVHFTNAEGSDIVLDPGSYGVEAAEEWLRVTPSEGQALDSLLLETQTATHEESLTEPLTVSTKGDSPDVYHLALLLPNGKRLEAIGSYSGVRSRGGLSLLSTQRIHILTVSSQNTASTEFSTPVFGGGGGNRLFNLDCGNGAVMVGITFYDQLWSAFGIICQRVHFQVGVLKDVFTQGPGTEHMSGGIVEVGQCERGQVIQGIKFDLGNSAGDRVLGFSMACSQWQPSTKSPSGSNHRFISLGGENASKGSPLFFCPPGKVGKAFRGKHDGYVQSVRFVCDDWDK